MGMINVCPASVSTAAEDYTEALETLVHEALHALGFHTESWVLFREHDGTPRTSREADGLPAITYLQRE
jgi:hypothetical protein